MKIAIAGCGIAGSTAAFLLARRGHELTLFEQAPECRPVGAGILLQPSGQAVLRQIDLLEDIASQSARIEMLHAVQSDQRTLVRLCYGDLGDKLYGLGVHRGTLFSALFGCCQSTGVSIQQGIEVARFEHQPDGVSPIDIGGRSLGTFDLLVAADGSRSRLRESSDLRVSVREYDFGALWTVGPCPEIRDQLIQIVGGTTRLVGLLPIGQGRCSFFWGIRNSDYQRIRDEGVDAWKQTVCEFAPAAQPVLDQIASFDDLTFATYRDVRMSRVHERRVVFIGDAAHATSPHLGQGANFALIDAATLAEQIGAPGDLDQGLIEYARARRSTTRFYSQLTRVLTPFFQSGSRIRGLGRDIALPWMPGLPFIGKQMIKTMAGLKRGWFA